MENDAEMSRLAKFCFLLRSLLTRVVGGSCRLAVGTTRLWRKSVRSIECLYMSLPATLAALVPVCSI